MSHSSTGAQRDLIELTTSAEKLSRVCRVFDDFESVVGGESSLFNWEVMSTLLFSKRSTNRSQAMGKEAPELGKETIS